MAAKIALLGFFFGFVFSNAHFAHASARKEVFTFFSANTPQGFYNSLPMQNITTIGLFSDHPDTEFPGLMQLARSHGTKVIKAVSFDDKQVPPPLLPYPPPLLPPHNLWHFSYRSQMPRTAHNGSVATSLLSRSWDMMA
jgi:hypothetical protein